MKEINTTKEAIKLATRINKIVEKNTDDLSVEQYWELKIVTYGILYIATLVDMSEDETIENNLQVCLEGVLKSIKLKFPQLNIKISIQ